jgi:hypothetical protein
VVLENLNYFFKICYSYSLLNLIFFRIPVQTIFDNDQEGGVVAMAMTPDARYLATLSSGPTQV